MLDLPEFLARPGADLAGGGYSLPRASVVEDHCNGLVLDWLGVLNPATGRRAYLPDERPRPVLPEEYFIDYGHLAFDPAESPHYQVFSVPLVLAVAFRRGVAGTEADPAVYGAVSWSEWPPSPFVLSVFSSRTGRWEQRSFVREGEAVGTVADMDYDLLIPHHSVCWRGALYVHRENDIVLRISLSDDTYRVIKPPKEIEELRGRVNVHLGRSQKGVYFALIDKHHLRVWILDDSCDEMDWVLRHHSGYGLALPRPKCNQEYYGPWILTKINNCSDYWTLQDANNRDEGDNNEAIAGQELGWDSDDENIPHTEESIQEQLGFEILGFHPYKEIFFLHRSSRGLAYHLNSSKLEDLGNLYPKDYTLVAGGCSCIENAFPYTPCWMGEL